MQKKQNYAEFLKDPRWQKKRLEIMQRDNFTCQYCGATDKELQVHHRFYLNGRKPWEYSNSALITLCDNCHAYAHLNIEMKTDIGAKVGDIFYEEYSDYFIYGLIYHIDYVNQLIYTLTIDMGAGFSDCNSHKYPFSMFKDKTTPLDNVFLYEDEYFSHSLFYCFYKNVKGEIIFDYWKDNPDKDEYLLFKSSVNEMLANNECLNDLFISAENGNVNYVND